MPFAQTVASVDTLEFDPDAFNELTTTVSTDAGDKVVTYRFYKAIPYVSRPVDLAYQSLNVSVPVIIDGVEVNASNATILLANSVGGYMPSSVAEADGVGGGGMTGMPAGGAMGGMPGDAPSEVASGDNAMMSQGKRVSNAEQALAAGYVVVAPGARGRTLVDGNGVYYGVAPAVIVDLKAAVRYIRFNRGRMPSPLRSSVTASTLPTTGKLATAP